MIGVVNFFSCGLAAAFLFHALPLSAQQDGPQNPTGVASERQFDACRHALVRACFKPSTCPPNRTGPCMVSTCKTVMVPVGNENLYAGAFALGMVISARTYKDFRGLNYREATANTNAIATCGEMWDAYALVRTYGNARERAAFDGSGPALGPVASAPVPAPAPKSAPVPPSMASSLARPKTPDEIKLESCKRAFENVRKAIVNRPQSEAERAKALAEVQRGFFSGACADHPRAKQYVAEADRMKTSGRLPAAGADPYGDTPIQGGRMPGDGPPSEGLIKVCEGNYQGMLRQVNGLQIAEREKDRLRAQGTLAAYKGGCSKVPGAQARVAAAERVLARLGIGGGGNVAGGGEPKGAAKTGGSGGGSCDALLRTLRKQTLSGGGDEAGKARTLGSWQKKFYTESCKTDSNAAQMVAEAEQMMRTGRLPGYLKSGNWDGGPNFAGGETKAASAELIKVCEGNYQAMRSQALNFQLPMAEINRIIAQQTIAIFKGRCSTLPGARERIAQAEKLLGGSSGGGGGPGVAGGSGGASGGGAAKKAKPRHVAEAVASHCLSLKPEGGFKNSCPYAIEYSYCVFRPKKDSWSESFDCDKNKIGSWHMGPYGESVGHSAGAKVHWVACKYGAAIGDGTPDGVSPRDVKWDSRQGLLTFRCAPW